MTCPHAQIEQLHKIFKLCGSPSEDYWAKAKLPDVTLFKPQRPYRRKIAETFKDFSPTALALLDTLLAIEPSARGTVASALDSEVIKQLSSVLFIGTNTPKETVSTDETLLHCISVVTSSSGPSRWRVIRRACPSTRRARSTTPSSEARRSAGTNLGAAAS
jgi:serine/threonine protein kinase